jgi:hypothetical protein
VSHHAVTREVVARPATEDERRQVLADSVAVYPGYVRYVQRIAGRRVRVFVLEPAA